MTEGFRQAESQPLTARKARVPALTPRHGRSAKVAAALGGEPRGLGRHLPSDKSASASLGEIHIVEEKGLQGISHA